MKLTQQQLADQLNVRRQSIIEIEQNQFNYRVDRLMEVLEGLGLKLIVVKKDAQVATMATTYSDEGGETFVFRGVKPLLEDPDQPQKKSRKKLA